MPIEHPWRGSEFLVQWAAWMVSRAGAALLLLGTALPGCVYNFDNPVAKESSGTVSGQVTLGTSAAGQSLAGARVSLLWSNLSVNLGADGGSFTFLDLPAGTYRLTITVPPPAGSPNDLPIEYSQGQVYLPQTPSGAPDALALGNIRLDLAGTVGGTVGGLGDGGAVVGAFEPDSPDGGLGEFEGYSTVTDATGTFSLTLPAGTHQLWASTATESGTLVANVQAAESAQGQQLTLAVPDGGTAADLVGYAVVGNYGAAAPVSQLQSILTDAGLSIALSPAAGVPKPDFAYQTPVPTAGVSGLRLEQQLLPGTLYQVSVGPPASLGTGQVVPATLENIPAIAGRTTFLQQIFLFSVATVDANEADGGSGVLLVDNDGVTPGGAADSLPQFQSWLTKVPLTYATYVEPADGGDTTDVDATDPSLAGIGTIVYFTGGLQTNTLSAAQQATLLSWLNAGGHTLILFSPKLVKDTGVNKWQSSETNAFLTQILGAEDDLDDPEAMISTGVEGPIDWSTATTVTGGTVTGFSGEQWYLDNGWVQGLAYQLSIIEPLPDADILATVQADPGDTGTYAAWPVAIGRKYIGNAGTSTVVWVGFTVEDLEPDQGGFDSPTAFLAAVQAYAGL